MATQCKECTATEGGKASSALEICGSLLHRNSRGGLLHSQPLIPGARSCVSAEKVIPNYPYRNIQQVNLCTSKSKHAKARSSSLQLLSSVLFCVVISRMQKPNPPLTYGIQTGVNFEYPKLFKWRSSLS